MTSNRRPGPPWQLLDPVQLSCSLAASGKTPTVTIGSHTYGSGMGLWVRATVIALAHHWHWLMREAVHLPWSVLTSLVLEAAIMKPRSNLPLGPMNNSKRPARLLRSPIVTDLLSITSLSNVMIFVAFFWEKDHDHRTESYSKPRMYPSVFHWSIFLGLMDPQVWSQPALLHPRMPSKTSQPLNVYG